MTAAEGYTLTAPARPAFITGVHDLLDQVWAENGTLTESDRTRFESAVIEVIGNIVVHSPVPDGLGGVTMRLCVDYTPDRLVAEVRDDGGPFEGSAGDSTMPDWEAESGRGLALARALTDDLRYERDASGNRWLITCLLPG